MIKLQLIVLTILISAVTMAQKPIFANAKVKAAVVYFNSAELTQKTEVNLPLGPSEIVIQNIASTVNENTIQVGAPSTLTVLSVQFTTNYMSEFDKEQNNPQLKKIRDSILLITKEIKKIQIQTHANTQTIALLDSNQVVSGANTSLNVGELMKLVPYYQSKRIELENNIITLQEKESKWNEKLQLLNNKLGLETPNKEKTTAGKIILQVMNTVAGNVTLDLSYLTNSASWSPFYDLKTNTIKEPITMMYKAQVMQNSGVDWKNVALTLSSGNPNQDNQAPEVQPWFLKQQSPLLLAEKLEGRTPGLVVADSPQTDDVIVMGYGTRKKSSINIKSSISNYTTVQENQLNISFAIDLPYDILSNGKPHSVSLKEIKIPASYRYYAAPRLDKKAYLLAEINDYSKYNLLQGEANIIFEQMYIGKTMINPNQTADTLKLSMGSDKKIDIMREKVVEKSGSRFLSSYKEQTFTYDITVKNNKKEPIDLLLKDQIPLSTDKETTIELLENGKAKMNQETGIVSWDMYLQPGEVKKIRLSYKVKHPKDSLFENL